MSNESVLALTRVPGDYPRLVHHDGVVVSLRRCQRCPPHRKARAEGFAFRRCQWKPEHYQGPYGCRSCVQSGC